MRTRLFALIVALASGCGEDPPESFATYQECFDSRTMEAAQLVPDAIVMCCLDHPIGGMTSSCGLTTPDCINYLTSNLSQTSASTVEVMDSCAAYIQKRNEQTPGA